MPRLSPAISTRWAVGSLNARSTLMTGMPASIAFWATGVSGPPSFRSTTSASGLGWIIVSIWSAWSAVEVAESLTVMSMPSALASALALSETALIQPWSAAGALKASLMSLCFAAASCVVADFGVAVGAAALSDLSLLPQAAAPSPTAAAAHTTGITRLNFIRALLLIGLPFQNT